jgi:hypothetical protein
MDRSFPLKTPFPPTSLPVRITLGARPFGLPLVTPSGEVAVLSLTAANIAGWAKASAVAARRAGWVPDAEWERYLSSLDAEWRAWVEADLARRIVADRTT